MRSNSGIHDRCRAHRSSLGVSTSRAASSRTSSSTTLHDDPLPSAASGQHQQPGQHGSSLFRIHRSGLRQPKTAFVPVGQSKPLFSTTLKTRGRQSSDVLVFRNDGAVGPIAVVHPRQNGSSRVSMELDGGGAVELVTQRAAMDRCVHVLRSQKRDAFRWHSVDQHSRSLCLTSARGERVARLDISLCSWLKVGTLELYDGREDDPPLDEVITCVVAMIHFACCCCCHMDRC